MLVPVFKCNENRYLKLKTEKRSFFQLKNQREVKERQTRTVSRDSRTHLHKFVTMLQNHKKHEMEANTLISGGWVGHKLQILKYERSTYTRLVCRPYREVL